MPRPPCQQLLAAYPDLTCGLGQGKPAVFPSADKPSSVISLKTCPAVAGFVEPELANIVDLLACIGSQQAHV